MQHYFSSTVIQIIDNSKSYARKQNGLFLLFISSHLSRLTMTCETGQLSTHAPVQCHHFQKPNAPRLLDWRRWNLARVFYGCGDKTSRKQNFKFQPMCHAGEMSHPVRGASVYGTGCT